MLVGFLFRDFLFLFNLIHLTETAYLNLKRFYIPFCMYNKRLENCTKYKQSWIYECKGQDEYKNVSIPINNAGYIKKKKQ